MKQLFLQQKQHRRLILFFSGWGMDEHLLSSVTFPSCDVMYCCDYRNLDFDETLVRPYSEIKVIAWSLGVWVASVILSRHQLPVTHSVAINGTMHPIDEHRGIPLPIFQGTIDHMDERGLYKFQRRMCSGPEQYQHFLAHASTRPVEELKEELQNIQEAILSENYTVAWNWEKAYIGRDDRIFTNVNQLQAWPHQTSLITLEEGHYCSSLFTQLLETDE